VAVEAVSAARDESSDFGRERAISADEESGVTVHEEAPAWSGAGASVVNHVLEQLLQRAVDQRVFLVEVGTEPVDDRDNRKCDAGGLPGREPRTCSRASRTKVTR
jgi:hypothetical protein